MKFDYAAATAKERNRKVAELLGWDGTSGYWNGIFIATAKDLPDFQGDNAVAFRWVFPELRRSNHDIRFSFNENGVVLFISLHPFGFTGESESQALCKALIEAEECK